MAALGTGRQAVLLVLLVASLMAAGCGGKALRWEPRVHVVRAGETLQAIAFRYRIDERDLAAWNGLGNPDLIFAGQRLRLSAPPDYQAAARPAAPPASKPAGKPARGAPAPATPAKPVEVGQWRWPASGPVVRGFGNTTSLGRGVDLTGNQGDAVTAAADGRVVYSGSGLLGYGKLIILKHNDTYLSAYGHNETLLVREGDQVRAGQRIATMGLGPGDRAILHFEIRRNGKPVDPTNFLPRRE